MGYYDTAQICKNGHVINDAYTISPSYNQDFCSKCGCETITTCQTCAAPIRGYYSSDTIVSFDSMDTPPNYCYKCGNAYPWTQEAINATEELLAIEDCLTKEELNYLHENMNSILVDTPKSKVVATKFKIALGKISSTTSSAIRDIIVDIASESVKKIIFPE